MEAEITDSDAARSNAPVGYDKARHPLTIADAVELFAELRTPRSKRSVHGPAGGSGSVESVRFGAMPEGGLTGHSAQAARPAVR